MIERAGFVDPSECEFHLLNKSLQKTNQYFNKREKYVYMISEAKKITDGILNLQKSNAGE